jgi:Plasmid recombination enzyme
MLLSASPEYFRPDAPHKGGIYEQQRLDDFVDAVVQWLKKSWGDRIVQAELHHDEITPHIHAYLVSIYFRYETRRRSKILFFNVRDQRAYSRD